MTTFSLGFPASKSLREQGQGLCLGPGRESHTVNGRQCQSSEAKMEELTV